ncbi:MAG: hypothetical protein KGP29_05875 [Proteobacteria bacterium]|nr:hypothetical protein [Pseudomonadota bacterium]
MQAKIKKLIRNTPEEDLKSLLDQYELNLPEDFKWRSDSKKYQTQLLNSIWNISDDHKANLFEIIERIHEMVDELGQAALQARQAIGNNDNFLNLKSEHSRCLWALKNHPQEFEKAEYCASLDYKRKSREWSSYVAPKEREIHNNKEHLEEFKQLALEHFNISKKIKVEIFERTKTDYHNKEIVVFQLIAYHDGLHKSVQAFEKEEVVTKFFPAVNEFSISYEPHTGIVEVVSDYKDNRGKLAKAFVNTFLKTDEDVDEISIKKFDLSKLKVPYDFMKDVDAKDLIEDVKVTLLKLRPLDSKNSTTLEALFNQHRSIYSLAQDWYSQNNPLHGSFTIKKARLSIKFKPTDKNPRGKLLHVMITDPNGCDLKDRSEREKMIGNKYLEKWGLMERI